MAYDFEGDSTFAGVRDVIVASGLDKAAADPLASSGLAGLYDAPLLLVRGDRPTTLPGGTAWALNQIKLDNPGVHIKFHIVGGPASVPDSLKSRILAASTSGSTIERIGGADRYTVASNIAARMRSVLGAGYPSVAFVVNGHDSAYFWNALMCGPVSFRSHWPILLVTRAGVPSVTASAKGHYHSLFVVASTADVTAANADAIIGSGAGSRISNPTTKGAGYNREKMARMFAEGAEVEGWLGSGHTSQVVGITNKLADSLAGGIFMGKKNGPLLYSYDAWGYSPETEEFLQKRRIDITRAYCFGGPASFSPDLHNRTNALLGGGD
jgi:N-acetylmuramoyl-L-alanine amidase